MKFHVGDLVKIIDKLHGHKFPIGEIVRVKYLRNGKLSECEYLDRHDYWHVSEEEVTPISGDISYGI